MNFRKSVIFNFAYIPRGHRIFLLVRTIPKINNKSSLLIFSCLKERTAFSIMNRPLPPLYRNEFTSAMNLRFNNSNFLNYQRVHESAAMLRHR